MIDRPYFLTVLFVLRNSIGTSCVKSQTTCAYPGIFSFYLRISRIALDNLAIERAKTHARVEIKRST